MSAARRALLPLALILLAMAALGTASASAAPRVVSGKPADDALYRAQLHSTVALISLDASNQYDGQFCGGMLIDELHVLTAAHCLVENEPLALRTAPSSFAVRAGSTQLSEGSLDRSTLVPVTEMFVHPFFNLSTFRYDAVVLRLGRAITDVPTLPILTVEENAALSIGAAEVPARVAGWGDSDPDDDNCCFPSRMETAAVQIHTDATCYANLRRSPTWRFSTEHQLCAGQLATRAAVGTDACQGDSGGPLLVQVGGAPRLAGITSHGVGCGQDYYGIYSRASALRAWLDSIPGIPADDARDGSHGPDDIAAPSGLTAEPAGYDRITLHVAPAAVGAAPTGYTAWARIGPARAAEDIFRGRHAGTDFTIQVPPVNTSARYRLFVRPLTANGEGPSATVLAAPLVDRRAPGATPGVRARRVGGSLQVSWRAAIDRESGIDGYAVQQQVGGRWTRPVEVDGRATRLRAGSGGKVRVRAVDRAGNAGRWSAAISF